MHTGITIPVDEELKVGEAKSLREDLTIRLAKKDIDVDIIITAFIEDYKITRLDQESFTIKQAVIIEIEYQKLLNEMR